MKLELEYYESGLTGIFIVAVLLISDGLAFGMLHVIYTIYVKG